MEPTFFLHYVMPLPPSPALLFLQEPDCSLTFVYFSTNPQGFAFFMPFFFFLPFLFVVVGFFSTLSFYFPPSSIPHLFFFPFAKPSLGFINSHYLFMKQQQQQRLAPSLPDGSCLPVLVLELSQSCDVVLSSWVLSFSSSFLFV